MAAALTFDQRDGFIWMNGELVPWRDAKLHVLTHALHYASAVFEGERAYDGEIFKLDRAQPAPARSRPSVLGFEIPYSRRRDRRSLPRRGRANKLADGYVRPIAWRGSEQMGVSAQTTKINLAIAAWDWPAPISIRRQRCKGIRLTSPNIAGPIRARRRPRARPPAST